MSLLLRSRALRPSAFASSVRSLATTVESSAPVDAPAAAPVAEASTSAAPAAELSSRRVPLPTTPPPTPYHPYVHVPLLQLFRSAASSSAPSSVVPLPSPLFNVPSRPSLLHKIIIAHLSSLRAGTASTKNRSEVNYSGKKTRPQKGTGGARLGSRGSPMLVGGGRAFGPRPKGPDGWKRKINRKEEQLGLRVALSEKWRTGRLSVVDQLAMEEPSTRVLKEKLAGRQWQDTLFIGANTPSPSAGLRSFELACGNLPDLAFLDNAEDINVWEVVKRKNVVLELEAVDQLIARIDPEGPWVLEEGLEEWEFEEGEEAEWEEAVAAEQLESELMDSEKEIQGKARQ